MKYESRVIILLEFQEVLLIENAIFFNIITQIHEYHSNRDSLRDHTITIFLTLLTMSNIEQQGIPQSAG